VLIPGAARFTVSGSLIPLGGCTVAAPPRGIPPPPPGHALTMSPGCASREVRKRRSRAALSVAFLWLPRLDSPRAYPGRTEEQEKCHGTQRRHIRGASGDPNGATEWYENLLDLVGCLSQHLCVTSTDGRDAVTLVTLFCGAWRVSLGDNYRQNRRPLRGSVQRRTSHAVSTL